jgi:anaerobic magnesium-protoporphyrin IX monomethyl ester cyclase
MKVLFLNPLRFTRRIGILSDLITSYISTPSLTFAQLAAYIPGNEITVIDGQVEDISVAAFLDKLKGVDIVAISIRSTYEAKDCEANIRIIKKYYPQIKVIMGGYHATFFYERWLMLGVDFVLLYEGERYFGQLIECLNKNEDYRCIQNLAYKDNGKVITNQISPLIDDLDSTPIPSFEIINFKNYSAFFPGNSYAGGIELSRGCSHQCKFCLTSRYWNFRYRRKSNQRILKELKLLVDKNVKKIWFYTAGFGMMPDEDYDLCELIAKSGLGISWRAPVRMDTVLESPGLIKKASGAGMKLALVGFESFNEGTIMEFEKTIKSPYNYANFNKAYNILRKNNILVEGAFIIGLPGEEENEDFFVPVKFSQVCDFLTIQIYRPNLALLPEILSCKADSEEYKRLFYFNPYFSSDKKNKNVILKRRRVLFWFYFHPFYIYSRFFLRGRLLRSLYARYYGRMFRNLFRKLAIKITHRDRKKPGIYAETNK